MKKVPVKDFLIGPGEPLALMCGPCVIEGEEFTLRIADRLVGIFNDRPLKLIFKASFDKANRSSVHSFRGPGMEEGIRILEKVRNEFGLPVVTDVHSEEQAEVVGALFEVVQIPAFLSRQTDLIYAAAKTGAVVSVKKGQFMAPMDMKNVIDKILSAGNEKIICVERGVSFGYNNLVCDMRSIPMMQSLGFPVCFDATHAVQLPGGMGDSSGGERQYVTTLAKAAVAAGANCVFLETHPDPANAKSDKATQLALDDLPKLLDALTKIYQAAQ